MAELIRNLNQEQKKAVQHHRGAMLVVAGPGTGKTKVLTHHLAYLIQQGHFQPENILALTFTQRAAQEMAERVDQLFPEAYLDLPVYTFHGWAQQLLESHGLDIGLPTPFRVLTERDLRILLSRHWDRFKFNYYQPQGSNRTLIAALISHFGRCKDENIGPDDYLKSFSQPPADGEEKQRRQEVAQAYHLYQEILLENDALDFGDLLYYSLRLLKARPQIRRQYQEKIKHLLIDEFQDTNLIQYQLAKLLAQPDNNLVVCASADQTIYQWRGAYYGNVDQFLKDYPRATKVFLKKNYRSAQNIIDLSYAFVRQNDELGRRETENGLQAMKPGRGVIKTWRFDRRSSELRGVSNKIVALIKQGVDPAKIAVLTRTNDQVYAFEEALRQARVPVQALTAGQVYRQPVVIDIIAYLTLRLERYNDTAFYRYLNFPNWSLTADDRDKLIHLSRRQGRPLAKVLESFSQDLSARGRSSARLMLKWLEDDRQPLLASLLTFLEGSGYFKKWLHASPSQVEVEALNVFLEELEQFQKNHPGLGLDYFLEQIEWERSFGSQASVSEISDAVSVMTVHGAKGLEFDHVFLVNLVDQAFPARRQSELIPWSDQAIDRLRHIGEERRLFFVAMTRARKGLYFSWAEDHGGQRRRKPSRFLSELGLDQTAEQISFGSPESVQSVRARPEKLPDRFSYTQLVSFRTCPWQYKLAHLLKVPTRGGPERSFGTSIHNTLTDFMKRWTESGGQTSWLELKQLYQQHWLDDWYQNDQQRRQYRSRGLQGLKRFYRAVNKEQPRVYHDGQSLWLEKNFIGSLGQYPFRGKIDRVDQTEAGLELIDYKTGAAKDKLSSDHKWQLLIYQLAAEQILKIKPARLTFYYLMEGQSRSFLGTEKELQRAQDKLIQTINQIQQSRFEAKPGRHCQHCDFRLICDHRR